MGPLVLLALVVGGCAAGSAPASSGQRFPPFVYASATSLETYRIAVAMPEVLAVLPCYCGCAKPSAGQAPHKNLKECFITPAGSFNEHAAGCDLCGKEALDAARWHKEGQSLREIRAATESKYREYGEPTDTPPPA